jgi:hypothetical protein
VKKCEEEEGTEKPAENRRKQISSSTMPLNVIRDLFEVLLLGVFVEK